MNLTGFPRHGVDILGIGVNAINLDDAVATIDHCYSKFIADIGQRNGRGPQ